MVTQTQTRPAVFTYADYVRLPEDVRCEIIDGELIMAASRDTKHQRIARDLLLLLHSFSQDNRLGETYHAPTAVYLSETNVVEPDLLFIAAARSQILTYDDVRGAPDLVIEIVSPATAEIDRIVKAELYGRFGVAEYWLCDEMAETVDTLRLADGRLAPAGHYTLTDPLSTSLLPGLSIDLRDVFPR